MDEAKAAAKTNEDLSKDLAASGLGEIDDWLLLVGTEFVQELKTAIQEFISEADKLGAQGEALLAKLPPLDDEAKYRAACVLIIEKMATQATKIDEVVSLLEEAAAHLAAMLPIRFGEKPLQPVPREASGSEQQTQSPDVGPTCEKNKSISANITCRVALVATLCLLRNPLIGDSGPGSKKMLDDLATTNEARVQDECKAFVQTRKRKSSGAAKEQATEAEKDEKDEPPSQKTAQIDSLLADVACEDEAQGKIKKKEKEKKDKKKDEKKDKAHKAEKNQKKDKKQKAEKATNQPAAGKKTPKAAAARARKA
jgi:hypothetical protein